MIIRLIFKNSSLICSPKSIFIDCPNKVGGMGNVIIQNNGINTPIWTGGEHIYLDKIGETSIHFSNLRKVEKRSSLDENNEEWKTIWDLQEKSFKSFSYETWNGFAEYLMESFKQIG